MEYNKTFRQLVVWQMAKELSFFIYNITLKFPIEERFAMSSQMRRASYSVLANIAEGNSRSTKKDRINFFLIARGSLVELDCFSELAYGLKYIKKEDYDKMLELINKTSFLLIKFIKSQK
jgi:four helix bundle protein